MLRFNTGLHILRILYALILLATFSVTEAASADIPDPTINFDLSGFCGGWGVRRVGEKKSLPLPGCKPFVFGPDNHYQGNCTTQLMLGTYDFIEVSNHGLTPVFSIGEDGNVSIVSGSDSKLATGSAGQLTRHTAVIKTIASGYKGAVGFERVTGLPGCEAGDSHLLPAGFRYLTFPGGVWTHQFQSYVFSEKTDVWERAKSGTTLKLRTADVFVQPIVQAGNKPPPVEWRLMVLNETVSKQERIIGAGHVVVPMVLQLSLQVISNGTFNEGVFNVTANCSVSTPYIDVGGYSFRLSASDCAP